VLKGNTFLQMKTNYIYYTTIEFMATITMRIYKNIHGYLYKTKL